MTAPNIEAVVAAAKIIYAAGDRHSWWKGPAIAYEQLDKISRVEFDGIIQDALRTAFAAQAVATERAKPAPSDLERARTVCLEPCGSDLILKWKPHLIEAVAAEFASARAEAVSAERERCARVVDRFVADGHRLIEARAGASLIAAAIRATDDGAD